MLGDKPLIWFCIFLVSLIIIFSVMIHYTEHRWAVVKEAQREEQRVVGYEEALAGVPAEACPWPDKCDSPRRVGWLQGWSKGFRERREKQQ